MGIFPILISSYAKCKGFYFRLYIKGMTAYLFFGPLKLTAVKLKKPLNNMSKAGVWYSKYK